ncbi:MAG TPA: hypothetical protein VF648_09750 [Pyrinomonadaceae bacterium]|jgi:hypothetical protein
MNTGNFDIGTMTRELKIEVCLADIETEKCLTGNAILQIAFSFDEIADDDLDEIEKHFLSVCERYNLDKRALANSLYLYFIARDEHGKTDTIRFIQD